MDPGSKGNYSGTSEKRLWWWRSSRRSILPQTGCRKEVSQRSRSLKRCVSGTMEKFAIPESLRGFPLGTLNIGQRRAPEEVVPTQATSWRGLGPGRASRPPGRPLAPLWPIFGDPEASVSLIFYICFWIFFGLRKIG